MRVSVLLLATLAVGSVSPAGDAVRDEVREVRQGQYEKGRAVACNLRMLNALSAQDLAAIERAEQHCAAAAVAARGS